MTVSVTHRTVLRQMASGQWVARIYREDGMPYGLTRPFNDRVDAEAWLVECFARELRDSRQDDGGDAA